MSSDTRQMRYVGPVEGSTFGPPIKELVGKTALVRDDPSSDTRLVLAQFDDLSLEVDGVMYAFGWHSFHGTEFEEVE